MLRSLVCLSAGLAVAVGAMAQDRQIRRDIRHGRIVRVVPDRNTIVVSAGTGAEAKTFEFTVSDATKFWGPDKQPLTDALRYKGFRAGAEVWYTLGAEANSRVISELRFYDPAVQAPGDEKVVYLEGKIVRVDPETGMVVVRTGTGNAVKDVELRVDKSTKYWAEAEKPITTGLRYEGFRPGTEIWYQVSPAGNARIMSDVRFYNPRRIRR
jgi:hypothetical protein